MKSRFNPFLSIALTLAVTTVLPAATLYWDGTSTTADADGGAGTWDITTTNWDNAATAGSDVAWPGTSTGNDDAVFGVTGGVVAIDAGGITANDIEFALEGYTLSGGTLTLDGTTNLLAATPNSNNVATISAPVSSTTGFAKTGSGMLTVNGENTALAGTITVENPPVATNNGGLVLSGANATGTVTTFNVNGSAAPTADGAWLGLANGATIASGAVVNLSGQGGNAAPQGTLRCTAGAATVDGTVNLLTGNTRISNLGTSFTLNGPVKATVGSGFGLLLRNAANQGLVFTNNTNYWEGTTQIHDGSYYFQPGTLPATSNLQMAASASTWFETSGSFTRTIGTGAGQVQFNATAGRVNGFSARGGELTVNIGGALTPSTLVWGVDGFVPAALGLNGPNATADITLSNPLDLNGGARTIQVSANTATLAGGIANNSATAASLRKTGAGNLPYDPGSAYTLTLAGLNAGGGTLELKSGTYTITGSAGTTQPDGSNGFIVARGGTFRLSGASITCTGGSYVFPAGNTGGGGNNFILDSGTLDAGAREALNAYGAGGTTTINGGLFICGDFRVGQSSTCGLNMNGGTLRTNRVKDAGSTTATVNLNGGTLQAKAAQTSFIDATLDNVFVQSGGAVIDSNGFNVAIPRVLDEDSNSTGGGLTKRGNGILDLTAAANNHTGANLIEGGVLRIADNAQLGSTTSPIAPVTVDGGEFGVSGTAISSITSLNRTFTYITGGFHVADASHTLDVDIDLTGSGGLSKSGAGTIVLTGANDFTGNLACGAGATGWIEVDSATDLGIGPKTGNFTASSQSGTGGIRLLGGIIATEVDLSIAGRNVDPETQQVLWNVSGDNKWPGDILIANTGGTYYLRSDADTLELSGTLGNTLVASVTPDTRVFNLQGPGDYLISGAIVDGVNENRFVGLAANGSGTVTLSGTNTYTGSTTVADGVLMVNGDNSAAIGAVAVNGDAVLGGTGTLGGAVTLATDAKLAPGTSAGTLTTSANVGGVGTLDIEIDGAAADKLVLTGTGIIDISTLKLNVSTLAGGATLPVYVIVDSAAAISGAAFASVTGVPSGYTLTYNYNDGVDSNNIALVSGTGSPFTTWATTNGLAGGDAAPGADPDNDGLDNAIEFVIGGQPNPANPNAASNGLAPTIDASGSNLVFTFRRTDLALTQPGIAIKVDYGSNLTGWTTAQDGVSGITVVPTDDFYGAGVDRVVVTIPKALASGSSMFARLNVSIP